MLEKGVELMVLGMGTVFVFLLIQIWVMNLVASFFKKYAHLFPEAPAELPIPSARPKSGDDDQLAVAIAVARAHADK